MGPTTLPPHTFFGNLLALSLYKSSPFNTHKNQGTKHLHISTQFFKMWKSNPSNTSGRGACEEGRNGRLAAALLNEEICCWHRTSEGIKKSIDKDHQNFSGERNAFRVFAGFSWRAKFCGALKGSAEENCLSVRQPIYFYSARLLRFFKNCI